MYREREKVCDWIESNLRFTNKTSANNPGRVSLERQPFMREPLESIADSRIKQIYLPWGAQTGKTTFCLLAFAWLLEFDPLPFLWTLPSDTVAKPFSVNRFKPFFEANPVLLKHKLADPSCYTDMEMSFDVLTLALTGSTSPTRVAMRPIAYVVMDEAAKYEHVKKSEGHPISLIEERTKSFPRKLIIYASTPNVEENLFWQGYLGSDQRHYFMPCPHCGDHIEFVFSRETVKWEGETLEEIQNSTYYVCPECEGKIYDHQKPEMMNKGEWRPMNPDAPSDCRGYHVNSLYSPYVTFGEYARKFVEAARSLHSAMLLQNLRNSYDALPYIKYAAKVADDAVEKLKHPSYVKHQVPIEPYYIITTYDPGERATHFETHVVGPKGSLYLIDWGTLIDIDHIAAHFDGLEYQYEGQILKPVIGLIDSGWKAKEAYEECQKLPGRLYPTKGVSTNVGIWAETEIPNYHGVILYKYIDTQAKIELYLDRIRDRKIAYYIPSDADRDLLFGYCGQILEVKPSGETSWRKVTNDHYGDCAKLACVSWWVLKKHFIDRELAGTKSE